MLQQVSQQEARIVCVSALPPFAVGQARSLCERLHSRFPNVKLVAGLWNYESGIVKAQERFQNVSIDFVATSLADALKQIRQLAEAMGESACEQQRERSGADLQYHPAL